MFFKKQKADESLMIKFWKWFEDNEQWIIATSKTDGMAVVDEVDVNLSPAFAYSKKEIEFQLGFNEGKGEFYFFDLKNRNLNRDAKRLAELMPSGLKERWDFIIEH